MPAYYFERSETVVSATVVIADTEGKARAALDWGGTSDAPVVYDEVIENELISSDRFELRPMPESVRLLLVVQGHLPSAKPPVLDFSHVVMGQQTKDEWDEIWQTIRSGQEALVSESIAEYFLSVLPPKYMKGKQFVFSDGPTYPVLFTNHGDNRYTMQGFADFDSLRQQTSLDVHYQG
jgi:hypothetical protein